MDCDISETLLACGRNGFATPRLLRSRFDRLLNRTLEQLFHLLGNRLERGHFIEHLRNLLVELSEPAHERLKLSPLLIDPGAWPTSRWSAHPRAEVLDRAGGRCAPTNWRHRDRLTATSDRAHLFA